MRGDAHDAPDDLAQIGHHADGRAGQGLRAIHRRRQDDTQLARAEPEAEAMLRDALNRGGARRGPEIVAVVGELIDDGSLRAAGKYLFAPRVAVDAAPVVRVLLAAARDRRLRPADDDGARVLEITALALEHMLPVGVLEGVEIAAAVAGGLHHDDAARHRMTDGAPGVYLHLDGQIMGAVGAEPRINEEDVA